MTSLTLDTNILFYAVDARDPAKHLTAKRVVAYLYRNEARIPLQCVFEFYHAVTRKGPAAAPVVQAFVADLLDNLVVEPANSQGLVAAMSLHREVGFQFFDCVLLATAARIGVTTLFSEDMQHRRQIGGVLIVNPFILTVAEVDRLLS